MHPGTAREKLALRIRVTFKTRIRWGEKQRHIGSFATPKQASAAHMSVRNDLADVNPSALSADEVDTLFDTEGTAVSNASRVLL